MAENSSNQSRDPSQKNFKDEQEDEDDTADNLQLGQAELGLQGVNAQETPETAAVACTSQERSPVVNARENESSVPVVFPMLMTSQLREEAMQSASDMVNRILESSRKMPDRHDFHDSVELITRMTSLMMQIRTHFERPNVLELQALIDNMEILKQSLSEETRSLFETTVEHHIRHIHESLSIIIGRLTN